MEKGILGVKRKAFKISILFKKRYIPVPHMAKTQFYFGFLNNFEFWIYYTFYRHHRSFLVVFLGFRGIHIAYGFQMQFSAFREENWNRVTFWIQSDFFCGFTHRVGGVGLQSYWILNKNGNLKKRFVCIIIYVFLCMYICIFLLLCPTTKNPLFFSRKKRRIDWDRMKTIFIK